MEIGLEIIGERNVSLRFDKFPQVARVNLVEAIRASTNELWEMVLGEAPKRTGKLASTIKQRVVQDANSVTGIVGVTEDFGKAGALEYGSRREIDMKLTHLFAYILTPPMEIERWTNVKAHSFLRGPLHDIAGSAFAAMEKAVEDATEA